MKQNCFLSFRKSNAAAPVDAQAVLSLQWTHTLCIFAASQHWYFSFCGHLGRHIWFFTMQSSFKPTPILDGIMNFSPCSRPLSRRLLDDIFDYLILQSPIYAISLRNYTLKIQWSLFFMEITLLCETLGFLLHVWKGRGVGFYFIYFFCIFQLKRTIWLSLCFTSTHFFLYSKENKKAKITECLRFFVFHCWYPIIRFCFIL